jgi:hypothetical protein
LLIPHAHPIQVLLFEVLVREGDMDNWQKKQSNPSQTSSPGSDSSAYFWQQFTFASKSATVCAAKA